MKRVPPNHTEALETLRTFILSDVTMRHSMRKLVQVAGMNEYDLKKRFKAHFSLTIYQLLMQHRLRHAKQLLITSDMPVSQIGEECGYSNSEYFTNFFKRHTRMTPTEFRKHLTVSHHLS